MKASATESARPAATPANAPGGQPVTLASEVRELMRAVGRRLRPGAPTVADDGYVVFSPQHDQTVPVAGHQVVVGPPDPACGPDLESGLSVRVIAAGGWPAAAAPRAVADQALHWVKLTDPASWRGAPAGADARVFLRSCFGSTWVA